MHLKEQQDLPGAGPAARRRQRKEVVEIMLDSWNCLQIALTLMYVGEEKLVMGKLDRSRSNQVTVAVIIAGVRMVDT